MSQSVGFSRETARTWATVDLGAIRGNVRAIQGMIPPNGLVMAVVKADGYGHGAVPVSRACVEAGVEHFAVATVAEAEELHDSLPDAILYLLSAFLPEEAADVARLDAVPMISCGEQLAALAEAGREYALPRRCFLMVDTGMGREGATPDEARSLWDYAQSHQSSIRVTGIATHFSCADEAEADAVTQAQGACLQSFVASLGGERLRDADDGRGNRGLWLSLWNSPATLRRFAFPGLPDLGRGTLYRAGLLLYGFEPYRDAFTDCPDIRPALTWQARVTLVKELPTGASVGYGRTHVLTRTSRIATLAVGYADGLSRHLSNRGTVLLDGQPFPIVGRISMDQCQVDVTDAARPIALGAIATLIGTDGPKRQTALDLAELVRTTPHDIPCALSRRVTRVYREEESAHP